MSSTPSNANNKNNNKASQQQSKSQQTLLTKKSLALSLSAPRAPPHSSAHRQLLLGRYPAKEAEWKIRGYTVRQSSSSNDNDGANREHKGKSSSTNKASVPDASSSSSSSSSSSNVTSAHSFYPHDTLGQRFASRWFQSRHHADAPHIKRRHPHLLAGPELGDQITRTLGLWLPIPWTNHIRDSGTFRSICDGAVTASVPIMGLVHWTAAQHFIDLTARCRRHVYGPDSRHYVDVYLPSKTTKQQQHQKHRLVFFIHGGAWGSGMPWMYRLCALPFLEQGWAVAIPAYRTYPDGNAMDQVQDIQQVLVALQTQYPQFFASDTGHVTLSGHSSGAHIALLLLVERARQQLTTTTKSTNYIATDNNNNHPWPRIDAFAGLSGPYDISHHFDYEAARGVEELSPMKAACGLTRRGFRENSPALRLLDSLATVSEGKENHVAATLPRHFLLLHSIEDETVPFTSTAEAARVLRSIGVTQCQELYIGPRTAHQDIVTQLMFGGPTSDALVEWLLSIEQQEDNEKSIGTSTAAPPKVTLYQPSKL